MAKKKVNLNAYFQSAAKMIPWSISIETGTIGGQKREDRFINVPAGEWDVAREDLTVRHLIKDHGFVIQDTIVCEKKTVYNPEIRLKFDRPKASIKTKDKTGFEVGNRFRVVSTQTALEISETQDGGKLTLKYVDGTKLPFPSSVELITTQLNRQTWIRM